MSIQFPTPASQGDTFTASNGVIYTYDNGGWTANSVSGLDNNYVNISGDTMTGDLTVPNLISEGDVQTTSLNGGQLAGFRNQFINGGMDVWQRATTYDSTSNDTMGYKTVDRWWNQGTDSTTGKTLQVASTSSSFTGMPEGFNYAFAWWDKADTSTRSAFIQAIELPVSGDKCRGAGPFTPGAQWTLSCYCSADITPQTPRMDFADDSGDSSNNVSYGAATNWVEIEAPTSTRWGRYAVTFTGSNNTFIDSTTCMRVVLGAIGREPTPPQFTSVSSRVAVTGCQLEPGPVATPFEHRPVATELALCQRYYYQVNTVPGGKGGRPTIPGISAVTKDSTNYLTMPALDQMRCSGMRTRATVGFHGPLTNPSKGGYVSNDNEWTSWYQGQGSGFKASTNKWSLESNDKGIYGISINQPTHVTSLQVGQTVGQKVISLDAEL